MSYEIIRSIKADKTANVITMRYACNNCTDAYGRLVEGTSEWMARGDASFEDKVYEIFKSDLDGNIKITSACGKFYILAKICREWNSLCNKSLKGMLDIDWKYKLHTYAEKRDFLARQAANMYFKKPVDDIDAYIESYAQKIIELDAQMADKYLKEDKVAIRSAQISTLYDNKMIVCADYDDNLYLCTKDQYENIGVLERASKAYKIPVQKALPNLFGVLAGNLCTRTKEEILDWYEKYPIARASKDAEMDEIKKLLSSLSIPEFIIQPWRDYKEVMA